MKRLARPALVLVAVAAACGGVVGSPPPIEPINACPLHPCSAYQPYVANGSTAQCNSGFCQVSSTLTSYTLVVSLPDTSYFAPNTTFVIPFASLFSSPSAMCPGGTCAHLPNVSVDESEYWPFAAVQSQEIGYYVGDVALPVQTVYRPLASLDDTTFVDAALLGLPLLPVVADVVPYTSVVLTSGELPGPNGDVNVAFRAELAPGMYERTVMPVSPYDAWFPPSIRTPTFPSTTPPDLDELQNIDTIGSSPAVPASLTITREDGAALDGWAAYLEDQTTLRRVSAATQLSNLTPTATSPFTYDVPLPSNPDRDGGQVFANAQLMLVPPPASVGVPTLVAPYQGGTILAPPYPTLIGPPALVSGSVTTADGSLPVPATLLIESTKILTVDSPTTDLVYSTQVATTNAMGDAASYSVVLPPGSYTVTVVPSDATSAKQSLPLLVSSTTMNGATVNTTQAGKNLALKAKTTVTGRASLSDGRALAGAQVEAKAAASLGPASLATPATPVTSWPRSATATTAVDGTFTLSLDPGTYDITIRPVDGTFLPWVVSPSRQVGTAPIALDPFVVPAPIVAGLRLADPQDNPIVGAIVRVFAVPTGGTAYVEIGRSFTDANGHYDMFVAGTPY